MTEQEFNLFKSRCDSVRKQRDRAEGGLSLLMKRLKEEFGCDDLKQVQPLADELAAEVVLIDGEIEEMESAWKIDYPHLFE